MVTIHQRQRQQTQSAQDKDEVLIPLLAQRSFHLPGNSWSEDWLQWQRNNHIIFGTCFHHRLHPIETWERIIVLAGSVSFALVATNIGYLWDWYESKSESEHEHEHEYHDEYEYEYEYEHGEDADLGGGGFDPSGVVYRWSWGVGTLEISYGTLLLWTFGSALHSLFDIVVWRLSACACCHPGGRCGGSPLAEKCRDLGSYLLIPLVLLLGGLAFYSSHLRVTNENASLEEEYGDDIVEAVTEGRLGEYSFLLRFGVELLLAWFLFSPLVSTLLLSGILGCNGRIPLLGGRPRDKKLLEKKLAEKKVGEGSSYARF